MDDSTTYNVRVYRTEVYKDTKVTTYKVRWKTAHRLWKEGFRNAALADSFRSSLLTAARKGEAFSLATGRPASWQRIESAVTWYDLVLDYVAAKWPYAAPNHRKSIAEALADATEAMLAGDEPPYPIDDIRRALRTWAFSDRLRGATEPPEDLAAIVTWLKDGHHPGVRVRPPWGWRCLLSSVARADQPQAGWNGCCRQHRQPEKGGAEQPDAVRRRDRCAIGQPAQGGQVDPPSHAQDRGPADGGQQRPSTAAAGYSRPARRTR